ncbi:2-oxo acid dehydrogenase subunit E2 [Buchnera aphidicola]|uniref:2-oxo acid dehydrogenase subunit E2 n=1 Tax=Buchnera aphidicola TaxID=9 RepID=UPI0031B8210B
MDIIVKLPDIGSDKVEVIEILVNVGDFIKKKSGLLNVEGKKTSIEIPSPKSGFIKKILVNVGQKIYKDFKIFILNIKKIKKKKINKIKNIKNNIKLFSNNFNNENIYASPLIRRLIRLNKIDKFKIIGSGRKGRILQEDLKKYIKKKNNNISNNKNVNKFGKIEILKLNNIQKSTIFNIKKSWKKIPHVTHFEEIDITKLEKFRKKYNKKFFTDKINNITLLPFLVKIIYKSLQKFPYFNSSLNEKKNIIILKKYINIGIVVNTKNGLFIPVLKKINKKSILKIFKKIKNFSKKAKNNKLSFYDMQGGSFTISNLGVFGGRMFTPIINYPEVSILGISKFVKNYFFINNKFKKKIILPISLSYDHRVINGVDAGKFISYINDVISDIRYLLM